MVQFDKNTDIVFHETSEWLPDRFQSRDRFHSHERLYMRRVQPPQDLFVHHWQLFHCSVRLYGEVGRGGRRGWRIFFSCGNNCFYFSSNQPLVRRTARPQTQQSLISYTAILCAVTQRSSPLREDTKNSWLQTHWTWIKKGIWTIVFVGLGLVTYWNSLCPRLEKWKLCR